MTELFNCCTFDTNVENVYSWQRGLDAQNARNIVDFLVTNHVTVSKIYIFIKCNFNAVL